MATEIIGLDNTNKILNSAIFNKDSIGFAVLVETYTLTPEGLENFNPQNLDPHPSFPTLTVETTNTEDMNGGLKRLTIRYIGSIKPSSEQYIGKPASQIPEQPDELDESDFAPPIITLFPAGKKQLMPSDANNPEIGFELWAYLRASGQSSGSWVAYPYIVNIQYIETASQEKELEFFNTYQVGLTPIPEEIRGVSMPKPDIGPFVDGAFGTSEIIYKGVLCSSASFERKGNINIISLSFKDNFYAVGI
jgi:hypothetical protein